MTDRPVSSVTGPGSVAVTPHHLASQAAIAVIARGGTAVDGAIAANAVLGMVLPTTCGIGGDLFAVVHSPGMTRPDVLNASGRGGSGLDAAALRAAGHTEMPLYQPASVTVPGCVDGWTALSQRHGRLPLTETLAPAIALGFDGFAASPELSSSLERLHGVIGQQQSAPTLYPGGAPPAPDAILYRPALASVLARIARDGRDALYSGDVAAAIVDATEGVLTASDLESNRADWVEPIGTDVFGLTGWTVPPNSQGYLTLATAWLLERYGVPDDPEDPAFHHAVIEAYRAVAWELGTLVADPAHVPLPSHKLLSPERLAPRIGRFDPDSVTPWPDPSPNPGGTAFLCVIDTEGMGVSLIQSNFHGIGVRLSAGKTGIWLHNRGAGFCVEQGHPNEAGPGKRPLHTLSPTLWTRPDGSLAMLLGTRGGHQQPQYLLQIIALLRHAGIDPNAAQRFPRWEMDHHSTDGSRVSVESRMPEHLVSGLVARGHVPTRVGDWPVGWGPVSIITVDDHGSRHGAADPRVSTAHAASD